MIKTIVVPIDNAEKGVGVAALGLAQDLAKAHGAKLVLLHVCEPVRGEIAPHLPKGFHERVLSDAAASLNEIAGEQGLADVAEVVVREGYPSTEILEYANGIGADMIVIASHDPGLVDYFLGSVAARVVRHAHCSVLVARNLEK
jgi:nucleotide-binding universal stress UspA family protein